MANKPLQDPSEPAPTTVPIEQRPGFGGFADKPEPDPQTSDSGKD